MSHGTREPFKNPVAEWVDSRLPILTLLVKEYRQFPTPKNFNYLWNFGAIAMIMLVLMIVTGLMLAMNYAPKDPGAFYAVERIMRDVNGGWLLRYMHANGASFFFIAVYIHIFRGVYYGSYKAPRELLWIFGVVILLLMMATAFMGYVLPWGQMSLWGATVIGNLPSAIPFIGKSIVTWLWGGFSVTEVTLNRFYAIHFVLPFVLFAVVFLHVWALHVTGSNNPAGIEPKTEKDTLPFHPYFTLKDGFGITVFLIFYFALVFFAPNMLGHPDNYELANPMKTPPHIVPEWYFLPFYAILRAVPDKLGGVIAMFGAIAVLFVLPWLDRSPVRSANYRPLFRTLFWGQVGVCILLGVCGAKPPEGIWIILGRLATLVYFGFFVALPFLPKYEKIAALPESIDEAYQASHSKAKSTAWSDAMAKVKDFTSTTTPMLLMVLAVSFGAVSSAQAAGGAHEAEIPDVTWRHDGPFGVYDSAALQRGFGVYKQVCASCHSLNLVSYRHLAGIGLEKEQIAALAKEVKITDGPNDEGEMFERPGLPSDHFPAPFANEQAARAANGGAYPPDLSLLAKSRHGGTSYIYGVLTGYKEPPEGEKLPAGMHYNVGFAGHLIGMPAPLTTEGQVEYAEGQPKPTVDQMAQDVAQFLTWAAEPHQDERKRLGVQVLLFLSVFAFILYLVKKNVWADVH